LHDASAASGLCPIDESQTSGSSPNRSHLLEKNFTRATIDRLFTIVDHLDQGIELVTAQPERTEIARLNLMAGQKAKSATAYEAAFISQGLNSSIQRVGRVSMTSP